MDWRFTDMRRFLRTSGLACILAASLFGCAKSPAPGSGSIMDSAPARPLDVSNIPDAVPKVEPKSRYGNIASYRVFGKKYHTLTSSKGYKARGVASWYGTKFHGHLTSSREPYDMYAMTAAHKSLPLPTYARVTNLKNGRSVVLRINDRGPFHDNRLIDLSYAAASKLDILRHGTGLVEVEAIDPSRPAAPPPAAKPSTPSQEPKLFLQVGAFGDRGNAERLLSRVKAEIRTNARIHELNHRPLPIYRVQVGPLASVESVDKLSQRLKTLGVHSSHVVVE